MEHPQTFELTKGQKTAVKILEAAARCISKEGIEKTSVTNIALEAKIKRSLVAYHFPKKGEIIYKVVDLIVAKMASYSSEATTDLYGKDALVSLFSSYLNFYQDNPHYFHVMLHFYYLASIEERAKHLNTAFTNRMVNKIKALLAQILMPLDIKISEKEMNFYCQAQVTWVIGTIMNSFCIENQISELHYRKRFAALCKREIEILVDTLRQTVIK